MGYIPQNPRKKHICPNCKKEDWIECGEEDGYVNLYCKRCGHLYGYKDWRRRPAPPKGQKSALTLPRVELSDLITR